MTAPPPPPGWYPDQADPRFVRWWDGQQWTQHVQQATPPQPPPQAQQQAAQQHAAQQPTQQPAAHPQAGQQPYQQQDMPQAPSAPQPGYAPSGYAQSGYPQQHAGPQDEGHAVELNIDSGHDPNKIQQQVQGSGAAPVAGGGGTLFTEPILVVNQKGKLVEMANEYQVFDQHGQPLGSVVQVGQSALKKAVRFLTKYDQFMTHKFEVRDNQHNPLLTLTRPAKVFKSKVQIAYPNGAAVGDIVQENVFGKITFTFLVNGQPIGGIFAENWRAWDFSVQDEQGTEVAKITKNWAGFARAAFTTADNYVVQLHRPLPDPLCTMVISSALTVDTALKQDS